MTRSSGANPSSGRAGEILMANHDANGVVTTPTANSRDGVNRRFIRELEQGKQTLRLDKLNQALAMFGHHAAPARKISQPMAACTSAA